MLAAMGADTNSLRFVSDFEAFHAYPQMLDPREVKVLLPNIRLPSQRAKLNSPLFSEVMWPVDDAVIQPGGLTGFFHDFYNMSVQRPYQEAPEFEFIRILVNPEGVTSKLSQPKCLITLHVRAKQASRESPFLHSWTPLHELMDCISVIYQTMFHGRVHPWRSKFQYLLHLEDQVVKSRKALLIALEDLEAWKRAEIHGVELAALPYAEWHVRVERLKKDASYLISSLDSLSERQSNIHVMLKEQLELNSGTRSLILTILASVYIPLAFVSSYFGMNTHEITEGGLLSAATYWKVSVPLVVASIFIPVAFSGLLVRTTLTTVYAAWNFPPTYYRSSGLAFQVLLLRIKLKLSMNDWFEWFNNVRKAMKRTPETQQDSSSQAAQRDGANSIAMA
ncbi:MAG: hypothetical protein Q9188_002380 [Gyalolechia gomerana]